MARVEIERQISFFSFGFARVSEVRHIEMTYLKYFVQIEVSIKNEKEKRKINNGI